MASPTRSTVAEQLDPPRLGPLDAAAPATILYTSGTTGRPKGAVLSNLAVHARCNYAAIEMEAAPGSAFVQTLPMFHIAANLAYAFTYNASTIVMVREFSVDATVRALHEHRATHVLLVPTTINMISNHPGIDAERFEHLRMVLYGASPIAPDVLRRAIKVFGCDFLQFFGMTETAGCALLRPADHDPDGRPDLLASAGTDGISFETRVVDGDDRTCPPGVVGEIVTRGPCVMDGYWNNPESTAEAMRNGWMHTGDLGYRSEEGYLFVTDRLKDMIVTGGENVYPPRGGGRAVRPSGRLRGGGHRRAGRAVGRAGPRHRRRPPRRHAHRGGDRGPLPGTAGRLQVPEDGRAGRGPAEERDGQDPQSASCGPSAGRTPVATWAEGRPTAQNSRLVSRRRYCAVRGSSGPISSSRSTNSWRAVSSSFTWSSRAESFGVVAVLRRRVVAQPGQGGDPAHLGRLGDAGQHLQRLLVLAALHERFGEARRRPSSLSGSSSRARRRLTSSPSLHQLGDL